MALLCNEQDPIRDLFVTPMATTWVTDHDSIRRHIQDVNKVTFPICNNVIKSFSALYILLSRPAPSPPPKLSLEHSGPFDPSIQSDHFRRATVLSLYHCILYIQC